VGGFQLLCQSKRAILSNEDPRLRRTLHVMGADEAKINQKLFSLN
jgi:hypothetical protein